MLIQDPNNPRFLTQNAGQQAPTRQLLANAGDPGAALSLTRGQASSVADSTPATKFSLALMDLLKRYQTLGTAPMQQQGFNAQSQQNQAILNQTSPDLIGAAPGVQAGVRSGQAGVYDPTIQGAQQAGQTFSEQLRGFGSAVDAARAFAKDLEGREATKRTEAGQIIEFALKGGSAGLEALIQAQPDIFKQAGMDAKTIQALLPSLKAKEAEERAQFNTRYGSSGTGSDQLYAGLSSATATAVRARVSKFSTEPLIQNFATVQEGRNFATSLADTTTNPADDQALIYSLAKALDPGSVVREGEYATAQKYAQSWVKAYGKGVTQAILGTGFLSQEARQNIKKTIEQKYNASKTSYDNLYKQYTSGINSLTGRGDGSSFLTDYAIPSADSGGSGQYPAGTDGASYGYPGYVSDGTQWVLKEQSPAGISTFVGPTSIFRR